MFFQNTILKKHLATLHEQSVQQAWDVYKAYFLNKEIQQNIRQSKEEQFQEGFLNELFVKVLGYTLNPSPDYNLITEQKNETDSKKADGAILADGKVIGIIELKDHKTTDLKQVEQQAFGYKHQHPAARYVIISNFEKLRFYIDNAVECMEWNLFTLTEEQFRVLYFCLSYPTLSQFEPIKAKAESVSTEDQITARLYKDYSAFKRELFADIVANNDGTQAARLSENDNAGTQAARLSETEDKSYYAAHYTEKGIINHSRHYLPHFENRSLQFITYRLYDSVPKEVVEQYKDELGILENKEVSEEQKIQLINKIDKYEDAGYGQCFLKDERVAKLVEENLWHFNGERYELINYCIMPNHVHVLIRILPNNSLSDIIHSWRSYTAHEANKILNRAGEFWMNEYFDRYIRNQEHFAKVYNYINNNPLKAGLVETADQWRWCYAAGALLWNAGGSPDDGTQAARLTEKVDERQASRLRSNLLLFKKTQKLLDRLLFIFFAEDCGLLPPNSMIQIIDQWQQLRELDEYVPLYNRIKKYFGYMNTGYKGKHYEIFAYNGGLFKPDEVLDSLIISDEVLAVNCRRLSEYDYASEVDVNILGHIFENSLNEIEEFYSNADSAGGDDRVPSKRKRDGVFYTPQYITKYIVENTVGRLCEEKKAELGISSEGILSLTSAREGKDSLTTKRRHLESLDQYRSWLLDLKICDPACGSGAFLNAALQFLMAEHRLIDEMQAKITGDSIVFQNIENSILENNLYGVDINEESVEIAKLALWLRVAKPHRKLSSLNDNIKCGNSLISDPTVAGDKAFDWAKEFPQVFANGGFDVVIGNPPYVRAELLPQADLEYYKQTYKAFTPDGDLFSYFYERGLSLLKKGGMFGFISNTFDKTAAGKVLRQYIQDNATIERYVDFTEVQVFEGATTYPIILLLSHNETQRWNAGGSPDDKFNALTDKRAACDPTFPYIKIPHEMQGKVDISLAPVKHVSQTSLNADSWSFQSAEMATILKKINAFPTIKEQYGKCYYGVKTALNDAFFINEEQREQLIAADAASAEIIKPVYEGRDLQKWCNPTLPKYLICTHNGYANTPKIDIEQYPALKAHLADFEPRLSQRYDKGDTPFNLRNCAYQPLFYQPKIIWGNLQSNNKFSFDERGTVISAPACMLPTDNKALLAVLNSRIVWLFLTSICVVRNGGYIEVKPQYFEQIPVPPLEGETALSLATLADKMLSLNEQLQQKRARFLRRLQDNITAATEDGRVPKITTALEQFDTLEFKAFVGELKKQKITLSLVQQDEWEEYFMQYKAACESLRQDIAAKDKEIDSLVYNLYGLTEEERAMIEQG